MEFVCQFMDTYNQRIMFVKDCNTDTFVDFRLGIKEPYFWTIIAMILLLISALESKNNICGGFIMSAPKAPFMYLWMDRALNDYYMVKKWSYIAGKVPSKLVIRYCKSGIVHVEAATIHNPHFTRLNQLIGPDHYDWSSNYAIHLWYRLWAEHKNWNKWKIDPNPESIKKSNTTFGQIARLIYYGSPNML